MQCCDHATTLCVFLFISVSSSLGQNFNATAIPAIVTGNIPIVSAAEDAENVTMFCEVFDNSNGQQVLTRWSLIRNSSNTVFFLFTLEGAGQQFFENMMVTPAAEFRSNFTILVFNNSFDNTHIGCSGDTNILSRFNLKIIKPPILYVESTEQIVGEGEPFQFDLEVIQGFPVIPDTFTWFFHGMPISEGSSNPNVSVYPFICFTSVSRSGSGNYSITAMNGGGSTSGSFILNVHYKPGGMPQSGPKYVLSGDDSVTVVGFASINGNPDPSSQWLKNSLPVGDIRFNTSVPGELTISSVVLSDAGNYTNTINNTVNGIPMKIDNTIVLVVVESPSMPNNVTVLEVGAEFVNISWSIPVNSGTPMLSHFAIQAVSLIDNINTTTDEISTLSTLYTYTVSELRPNTEYTITIRAMSTVTQLGVLLSDQSKAVVFNTTIGVPRIRKVLINNISGNISVLWALLHTGGTDLRMFIVQCSVEYNGESASMKLLESTVECMTMNECLMGSVSVGPVNAGLNYSCLVVAENSVGKIEKRTDSIPVATGIPSVPVIISVSTGAGFATIVLRVNSFGVLVTSDFTFIVSVFSPSDTSSPVAVKMITPDSIIVSTMVMIVVKDLPGGNYVFSLVSSNIFGSSVSSILSPQAMVLQNTTTTNVTAGLTTSASSLVSSTSTPMTRASNSNGIYILIISVLMAVILILLLIVGIFSFIFLNKKNVPPCDSLMNIVKGLPKRETEMVRKERSKEIQLIDMQQNLAYDQIPRPPDDSCIMYDTVK